VVLLFLLLFCYSCDSGDIYPDDKQTEEVNINVDANFSFTNIDAFPKNYTIVLGAFIGTSPYPLSYQAIAKPTGSESVHISLSKLPKGTTQLALALMEKVDNKKRHVFYAYSIGNESEDIEIDEVIDLATFARVQNQVFTPQCIQCHGAGGLAAGLDLTEENAYSMLVDMPSHEDNSFKNRVTKYSLQNSFLLDVLTEVVPTVTTNHTTLSSLDADDDINLIKAWIIAGAEE
jgi:hypothetical protein